AEGGDMTEVEAQAHVGRAVGPHALELLHRPRELLLPRSRLVVASEERAEEQRLDLAVGLIGRGQGRTRGALPHARRMLLRESGAREAQHERERGRRAHQRDPPARCGESPAFFRAAMPRWRACSANGPRSPPPARYLSHASAAWRASIASNTSAPAPSSP